MSDPHPVVHFEILGRDQRLLEEFYKDVFDWEITPIMEGYSLVKPGSGIAGGIGAMGEGRVHVTFYVAVEDVAAALELIESKVSPKGVIFANYKRAGKVKTGKRTRPTASFQPTDG